LGDRANEALSPPDLSRKPPDLAPEHVPEATEIPESDGEGCFAHAMATAAEQLRGLRDPNADQIAVRSLTDLLTKKAREAEAAHAHVSGEVLDGERLCVAKVDAVERSADAWVTSSHVRARRKSNVDAAYERVDASS
jgi:hypothetical protein